MANIPKNPPKQEIGHPGRHICNNLLNEAIIDTGKTRGGPCSAICLVFVFLFFWGVGGLKEPHFIAKETLTWKATDIFTTTIKK